MVEELRNHELRRSANDFIFALERAWGGRLYIGISPEFKKHPLLLNFKPPEGLKTLFGLDNANQKVLNGSDVENLVWGFRTTTVQNMPHPERANDIIHIYTDPFCREYLLGELEWVFQECMGIERNDTHVVKDKLPFNFISTDTSLLSQRQKVIELKDFFELVKSKASDFSHMLDGLTNNQRARFIKDFRLSMDCLSDCVRKIKKGEDLDLHPYIRLVGRNVIQSFEDICVL